MRFKFALAVLFSVATLAEAQTVVINEIQTSNIDQKVDPSYNFGGWIELYNPGTSTVSLTGWWLSDDPDHLKKAKIGTATTIPAKGYKALFFDNYDWKYAPKMIDMKLDTEGGIIYLSNANGTLITSLEYPAAIGRCSYARTTDGGNEWGWTGTPTPDASNASSTFCTKQLEKPVVSKEPGLFSTVSSFTVTIPEGCTLRYTTNGSTPTLSLGNTSNTGVFSTTNTTTYKFRLFRDGYLPSEVVTQTMIQNINNRYTLPIISISSSSDNFYGSQMGIFTRGTNGRPGRGQSTKCNWNMDWERPAAFEYWVDGKQVVNQEAGIERCGGWSRAWTPYSFKVRANKRYHGKNTLNYKFFADKPYLRQKALQIRNGGNDNGCRIKDAALQEIVSRSGLYVDGQAYQPVHHFINGTYKGVINMRETNNKDFAYANYGLDDDELDAFEMSPDSGYVQVKGTKEAYRQWYTLSKNCASESVYEQIKELVDIDEYINYMAVEFYVCNSDWPQNNVKAFKSQLEGGKFHFVLFDLDAMDWTNDPFNTFFNKKNYTYDALYDCPEISGGRISAEIEFVTIFQNMLQNATFRKQFIDTYCMVVGSVFDPTRCRNIINELANRVSTPMSLDNTSPWSTANDMISKLSSSRQSQLMSKLRSRSDFQLSSKTAQKVTLSTNTPQARIYINNMPVPTNKFSGQLYAPITVKAQAPAGYTFSGWRKSTTSQQTLLASSSNWKYYDKGSLDGQNWYGTSFSDASWTTGKAPLGYYTGGGRSFGTTLSYGTNTSNKRPTYYFRTSVNLTEVPSASEIDFNYRIDDGFVLYINGVEAARYNMPSGSVSYSTYATTYAEGNPDVGTLSVSSNYFKPGKNVIAVEVHNNSASSTDVEWDCSITCQNASGSTLVCSTEEYTLPTSGAVEVVATYTKDVTPVGTGSHAVVINEVSAANSIHANEFWKKNDWIELYNTTDADIDLAGMYLTDKMSKPQKWEITAGETGASTIIPAHGYKVIWCDKVENGEGELHANFKLSNDEGSLVMLTAADGSWSDSLYYCSHQGIESVGRYPDGAETLYVFNRTTPGQTNQMTLSSLSRTTPNVAGIDEVKADFSSDTYWVYDVQGMLVHQGQGQLRIAHLPAGIYIVKSGNRSYKLVR